MGAFVSEIKNAFMGTENGKESILVFGRKEQNQDI